jgi:RNA polymerase sigma-70 factor (ECF subfamily)
MSKDETRLIQRAKEGDPAAFAEIYDLHQPAVYHYTLCRVGDAVVAEDLTSEVFARLVEKIDHFTYQGRPLLAWLYTIARNLITDHQRRAVQKTMLPPYERLMTEADDLEQKVERGLARQRLVAALPSLTQDQRQVIHLKFIKGLDNAETARTLGKSVGAIKSLQHRALAALRRTLEKDEN